MIEEIEKIDGFWWPKKDKICRPYTLNEKSMPAEISSMVPNKRTVIQAGGNVGYYALEYSKMFKTVYTFEPDYINFMCLVLNVPQENVIKMQACLGDKITPVDIERNVNSPFTLRDEDGTIEKIEGLNTGGYFVNGPGKIPSLTIDNLNLEDVDLIHLDTEGYEGPILHGSVNTIMKYKPLIVVEIGHNNGKRFNWPKGQVRKFLGDLGYQEKTNYSADYVFEWGEKNNEI